MEKKKMGFGARVKESVRKLIVSLKHKPHNIPMLMLVITFLYYSLNLTNISNATDKVGVFPMGLCGFIAMLFSMLSLVCFMNAFPNRKPVNKTMLTLMYVMVAAVFISDVIYMLTMIVAATGSDYFKANPLYPVIQAITAISEAKEIPTLSLNPTKLAIVNQALRNLWTHGILLLVSIGLVILLPVYAKVIRKIDTSIEVEAGKDIATIDISGEN